MSATEVFQIDDNADFPHLPGSPIVEAALHWRAAAGKPFDKSYVQEELKRRFPNYDCQTQQELGAAFQSSPEGMEFRQRSRWDGFRLTGKGEADRYIAQFKPNGVVFSRLKPYQRWEPFQAEGLRFWQAYLEIAEPPVIERLGVRFISQIPLGADGKPSAFLRGIPDPPPGIGLSSDLFFHQDTYRVAGYPYQINWVRIVQPTTETERGLIVDVDVSTERVKSLDREALLKHLAEMRFLKNKLFFTCMTEQAIDQFRKDAT